MNQHPRFDDELFFKQGIIRYIGGDSRLEKLPPKILQSIIQFCDQKSRLELNETSRRLHEASKQFIVDRIKFATTIHQLKYLCNRILTTHAHIRENTRSLSVSLVRSSDTHTDMGLLGVPPERRMSRLHKLLQVMRDMTSLKEVSLHFAYPEIRPEFRSNISSFVENSPLPEKKFDNITIVHATGYPKANVNFFLKLFPNIQALEIDSYSLKRWAHDSQTLVKIPGLARVKSLKVNLPREDALRQRFESHSDSIFSWIPRTFASVQDLIVTGNLYYEPAYYSNLSSGPLAFIVRPLRRLVRLRRLAFGAVPIDSDSEDDEDGEGDIMPALARLHFSYSTVLQSVWIIGEGLDMRVFEADRSTSIVLNGNQRPIIPTRELNIKSEDVQSD